MNKPDPYPGTPNKINILWCVGNGLDPELSVPAGQADLSDQASVFIAFGSHVRLDFLYCSLVSCLNSKCAVITFIVFRVDG